MSLIQNIGNRRELFVDYNIIDQLENTGLRLHEPISGGVAIRSDSPWEGQIGGINVFKYNDLYLMYYGTIQEEEDSYVLCVAVSEDGINWNKPKLGLCERAGSKANNVTSDEEGKAFMAIPWFDTRNGVPKHERIKALTSQPISGEKHTAYCDPRGPKRLILWTSSDGFTFRKMEPQPDFVSSLPNSFDGGVDMFWSEVEQQYVLYYRFWDLDSGAPSADVARLGGRGYRSMARATSKDLMTWTPPVPMTYGDTPREQFYTNQTQPYFRAPHIYVAPAARFMEGRRVITDKQADTIGLISSHGHFYGNDCSDGVLLTTRAGSTQYDRTFMETFIRPGLGAENWVSRTNYPLTGILPCGSDQMMLYVSRHNMQVTTFIERLLLRLDGFASVTAPWVGGEMITKPLVFKGNKLEINYRTGAAGSIRVEIQDINATPIPGYTLDDCPEIIGDEISRVISWKNGEKVSQVEGQPIRLRFVMKEADLFSIKFIE